METELQGNKLMVIYLVVAACLVTLLFMGCQFVGKESYKLNPGDSMFLEVKVAAVSFEPRGFDVEWNVEKMEELFRAAAEEGALLAVAPEGAVEGCVVPKQIIQCKVPSDRIFDVAVTMDGPVIRRFRNLARELKMCLAFGCAERIGDEVYNCTVFIDDNGKLCGKYHKMQFAEGYHPSWWFNRLGKKSRAIETPFGRCGFMICNDRWNPALARILVLDGAQFLLIPAFGSRGKHQDEAVLARARENGVPIVEANVGVTLIISKGEIVESCRETETVTVGTIAIPAAPSARNRDAQERAFLRWRVPEMQKRYRERGGDQDGSVDKEPAVTETEQVHITNTDGTVTIVELKKSGTDYIGPKGEVYSDGLPTEDELRPLYGR